MKLPSILLPFGFRSRPTEILPAHPVGNVYWVKEALGSIVGDGSPMGDGKPEFDANDREICLPYRLVKAMVIRSSSDAVLNGSVVPVIETACVIEVEGGEVLVCIANALGDGVGRNAITVATTVMVERETQSVMLLATRAVSMVQINR